MGPKGLTFPRLSLSNCERDRSDEPVRILYSAEPSVGSKSAIGCSNILSFGKPLEGLKAGNRRSNNRTIYVRMRLIIYLFIYFIYYLFNPSHARPLSRSSPSRSNSAGSLAASGRAVDSSSRQHSPRVPPTATAATSCPYSGCAPRSPSRTGASRYVLSQQQPSTNHPPSNAHLPPSPSNTSRNPPSRKTTPTK